MCLEIGPIRGRPSRAAIPFNLAHYRPPCRLSDAAVDTAICNATSSLRPIIEDNLLFAAVADDFDVIVVGRVFQIGVASRFVMERDDETMCEAFGLVLGA